jgi:hypothetical protein
MRYKRTFLSLPYAGAGSSMLAPKLLAVEEG